jgi:hypothetical protein
MERQMAGIESFMTAIDTRLRSKKYQSIHAELGRCAARGHLDKLGTGFDKLSPNG